MFFSRPYNLVALFPSLPFLFFFLSVETETESSSASITNIKAPDSALTERRPARLCPAPLNHRRINITIGGWRAFRLKWWHIVRARPRSDPRARPAPRLLRSSAPAPRSPRPPGEAAARGSPRRAPCAAAGRGRCGRGCARVGAEALCWGEDPVRLVQSGRGGRFYAKLMQMKAQKLLTWEYRFPDLGGGG